MTALTFMQYSVAHNAAKIFGKQSGMPIYVYQMPEVARELALYSEAPCHEIDTVESTYADQRKLLFACQARSGTATAFGISAIQISLPDMELVVHKTGTFNKLLQLAKGTWPLETIDFLEYAAR